jgi:hypothetical protein
VDFTDLNRACPKDPFPLPRIDQIVDSTAGCDLLCFLDAFSGYHQIRMAEEDEEKTAFLTPEGCFCFTSMPFGLKNAGATFQRAMRACLGSQMGRNIDAYIDDIVVKARKGKDLVQDLQETFDNLRKISLKLNPAECTFGVPSGKLLGYLVSHRGIEANPDKIKAIEAIQVPRRIKDVQRLNGCLTALWRFISRLGERALPLFKLLKRKGPFQWTPEAQAVLEDLKRYLSTPPVLVAPREAEPLFLYIAATNQTVSGVLVVERDRPCPNNKAPGSATGGRQTRRVQLPVYYVSSVLRDAREWYPEIQKILLGVVLAARKLRHYFEAHPITVRSSYPLSRMLSNAHAPSRVAEWSVELSHYDINFDNDKTIRSKALA